MERLKIGDYVKDAVNKNYLGVNSIWQIVKLGDEGECELREVNHSHSKSGTGGVIYNTMFLNPATVKDFIKTMSVEQLAGILVEGRCVRCNFLKEFRKNSNSQVHSCKNNSCYEGVKQLLSLPLTDELIEELGGEK